MCTVLLAVKGTADGLLVMSAAKGVLVNATTLTLSGIANTSSWVKYSPSPRAGAIAEVGGSSSGMPCAMRTPVIAEFPLTPGHSELGRRS